MIKFEQTVLNLILQICKIPHNSQIETLQTSNAGPIMRHGPHQSAQKSATTNLSPEDSNTVAKSSCDKTQVADYD